MFRAFSNVHNVTKWYTSIHFDFLEGVLITLIENTVSRNERQQLQQVSYNDVQRSNCLCPKGEKSSLRDSWSTSATYQ
jgi:hypothetical protein